MVHNNRVIKKINNFRPQRVNATCIVTPLLFLSKGHDKAQQERASSPGAAAECVGSHAQGAEEPQRLTTRCGTQGIPGWCL